MMRWIAVARLLCTLCLLTAGRAQAADPDLQSVLAAPNAPDIVDAMKPSDRRNMVLDLVDAMVAKPDNLDIPKLLCAIRPWTTADPDDKARRADAHIQSRVWREMAGLDPQSPRFRWLDCVAVNVLGGYRDTSLAPLYDLRQSYCTGVPIAKDLPRYLTELQKRIEAFNATVRRGMAESSGAVPRFSYYPLRNEIRLSTLGAARAVAFAQAGDMGTARATFSSVAGRLKEVMDKVDYANTRSGWVYHSDLRLHLALYDWLGRGSGPMDLSALKTWPAALRDPEIAGAVPDRTRDRMIAKDDTHYVDPVFVERLLPGAAGVESECNEWRRRSFDTRDLATQIETCANDLSQPPTNAEELRRLDMCIGEYQAGDWRVQFSSVHPDRVDDGVRNARILANDLMLTPQFQSLPEEQQDRIANNLRTVHDEENSDRYSRIVTNHDLLTEDRTTLEQIFDDLKLSNRPLMAREAIY